MISELESRDSGRMTMRTILISAMLLFTAVGMAVAQDIAPPLPADLTYIAEKAEDIIDLYQGGEWRPAQAVVDSMSAREEAVEAELRSDNLPISSAYLFDYFLFELRELTKQQTQSLQAALTANQITALLIDAQSHYEHKVPLEVAWMDYLGREIVLLAQYPDDKLTLRHRITELEETWTSIKGDVNRRNGSAVALDVDSEISKLLATDSRPEIISGANRILDLVDKLEALYR